MGGWGRGAWAIVFLGAAIAAGGPEEPGTSEDTVEGRGSGRARTESTGDDLQTTVTAQRPITAASSTTVRDRDLKLRQLRRPADVVSVTPGIYVVQHAGGGKANQYFLRGFDADHGTDVALFVDGTPINLVSHGHGQGYSDLNWLIPEMVQRVEVKKGTYFPELGDFASAGGINIITKKGVDDNQASLSGGSFGTLRAVALASSAKSDWQPLIATELYRTDGPFLNPEKTGRYSVFTKLTRDFTPRTQLSVTGMGYGSNWNASGQLPLRAVNAGTLNRFGSIDPTEGGDSNRFGLSAALTHAPDPDRRFKLVTYASYQRLNIYSDFTFFSRDPVNGDEINQRDNRVYGGADASYRFVERWGTTPFETTVGLQTRADNVDNSLRYDKARVELSIPAMAQVRERSLALYLNEEVTWTRWLRTVAGGRVDYYNFAVRNELIGGDLGSKEASLVSPKASVIATVAKDTDLFANYGVGFHSNDARGVLNLAGTGGATALSPAQGYELGARTKLLDGRLDVAGAAFLINRDDELVWSGDDAVTQPIGPTKRQGLELEGRYKFNDWLDGDVDLTLAQARIRTAPAGGNFVPNAPTRLLTAGLTARHAAGYFGRFSMLHIADRPLNQNASLIAEGFMRFDATAGYRAKSWEVAVTLQNVFNTVWREAQVATVSRLPSETSAASCPAGTNPVSEGGAFKGCEDVHFTPGAPLNVQATASVFF